MGAGVRGGTDARAGGRGAVYPPAISIRFWWLSSASSAVGTWIQPSRAATGRSVASGKMVRPSSAARAINAVAGARRGHNLHIRIVAALLRILLLQLVFNPLQRRLLERFTLTQPDIGQTLAQAVFRQQLVTRQGNAADARTLHYPDTHGVAITQDLYIIKLASGKQGLNALCHILRRHRLAGVGGGPHAQQRRDLVGGTARLREGGPLGHAPVEVRG